MNARDELANECTCRQTDPKTWTRYGGAIEPGSVFEPDPDCPTHRTEMMNARDELAEIIDDRWHGYGYNPQGAADAILAAGYVKPKPPTTEAIEAAARAVYAKTPSSKIFEWDLLPRIVQHEIRELALTAINAVKEAQP